MISVRKPGLLTTVQDLGRPGFQQYGVVVGGALDGFAARVANLIVGNDDHAAVLEMAQIGPDLRFDRETSFMVTIGATLLLAPLLWDHYLAALILPAAFLAQRGRLWGLGLPLLAWLPPEVLPLLAVAGTFVPFVARRPREDAPPPEAQPMFISAIPIIRGVCRMYRSPSAYS